MPPPSTVPRALGRPIPRFLLPRGPSRHASTKPTTPRTLEKPTKFAPPSHPSRLPRSSPRQYPGPPLSATQLAAQKTKQYPHMLPPDGSFMRWFLTNRSIHIYITLGTLFSLAGATFIIDFRRSSPFAHLLPEKGWVLREPLAGARRWAEVYKLTVERRSEEAAERRRRGVEDVAKRRAWRVGQGLERKSEEGEVVGGRGLLEEWWKGGAEAEMGGEREGQEVVRRKPVVKKWLGIW